MSVEAPRPGGRSAEGARRVPARMALAAAVERLRAAGIEGAAGDARRLLAHALGVERGRLAALISDPIDPAPFQALVARRVLREPVARIIGRRDFWGRSFVVTPDVLDPRPETELLVELALTRPFARALDLGTGSGCLAVTLAAERAGAEVTATDISGAALAVARRNAAAHGVAARIAFVQGSWFAPVTGQFSLIVANPPYIAANEMAALDPEVRHWDPEIALGDGADGLSAFRAIVAGAPAHLAPGGRLIVETGWRQTAAVAALFRDAGLAQIGVHCDLSGHGRAVCGLRAPGA